MVEAGSTSETTTIPTQEVMGIVGRLKAVLEIRGDLNFDPRTGEKLDTPLRQLQTLVGILEDLNKRDKNFHQRSW